VPVKRCLLVLSSVAAVAASAAPAGAQAPAGPPGPPPGNGGALPAPPGTAPAFVPPGTPAAVPGAVTGPGLLSGSSVALNRAKRTFSVALACQANGSVSVTAKAVTKTPIAHASYRCAANRASAALRVSSKVAQRLAKRKTVAATATVKQAGKTAKLAFVLRAGGAAPAPAGFRTDGHLQCTDASGAPAALLLEPDFTTATQTPISTRGWIAWYTAAGGWHWLGVAGENANRWDTWTANVGGIEQFHPGGAPARAVDVGPDLDPHRPGHRGHRRRRDRLLGRRQARVPLAVRQRGDDGCGRGRRGESVLRVSVMLVL
jgi:hypothetical protein